MNGSIIFLFSCILQSEERGKDEENKEQLRAVGSSPCVVAGNSFNVRDNIADPEQGIYHGFYRLGMWICITDRDVWRRHDFNLIEGIHFTNFEHCSFI